MSRCLPYHHPDTDRLSIEFVTDERSEAVEKVDELDSDEIGLIENFNLNQEVYIVYAGQKVLDVPSDVELEIQSEVEEMEKQNQIIATRILGLFEAIVEEKYREEGERLAAYKELQIDKVPDTLDRVSWNDSVAVAGGELLSSLLVTHALPNANHRTSLAMMSLYFQAISKSFEMPTTSTDNYDWKNWVDEYIVNSKRLLTVRRNVPRFQYLREFGCTTVERKGGIRIELSNYDLSLGHWDAMDHYADAHYDLSIDFAHEVLEKAGTLELRNGDPLSKEKFARELQKMK
mgnify:CR=1 FL=1